MVRRHGQTDAVRVDRVTFDRVRLAILSLTVFLGILLVFDTAVDLWRSRQQAMANAEREARNLTLLLEGHAVGALGEIDLPKVRGTCALAGLGVGFPMLDQQLVDFSMRLPIDYKLRGVKLRWFFKEALRGFLPDDIINKKKQGFGLPFGPWAVKDAALNKLATDTLYSLAGRGVVQPGFIQSLLSQRLQEHPGYYGEMVWILMMLEQWLQHHAPGYRLAD